MLGANDAEGYLLKVRIMLVELICYLDVKRPPGSNPFAL